MKKLLFLLIAAAFALSADAAKVVYSADGVLTYSESTESGDIKFVFKKCMINKLFTFYQVYINDKLVNTAEYSDNIGPFWVSQGNVFMGGNHNTPQNGSKPSAYTVSTKVFIDGKQLALGETANKVSVVKIEVDNEIFYTDDKKFTDEHMTYIVSGNSIDVFASHDFCHPTPMNVFRYYGPQSMFTATELLLPGFRDNKWISLSGKKEIDITKAQMPSFSTYIEKNADGYQAVLKYPYGIGDASCVSASGEVYLFRNYGAATGKSYHVMMWDHPVKAGDHTEWHALYSWFDGPIKDTFRTEVADPEFIYETYIDGQSTEITVGADGKSTEPTTGIEDITVGSNADFAYAEDGLITISSDAPDAVCVDLAGKVIARGAGAFSCPQGVYIVNDMHGRSVKLVVR